LSKEDAVFIKRGAATRHDQKTDESENEDEDEYSHPTWPKAGRILNRFVGECKILNKAFGQARALVSGRLLEPRVRSEGVQCTHEIEWLLGADEDPLAIVEFELDALIATDVVRLSIPSIANAPTAVFPNRTVGSGFANLDGIKGKSQKGKVEGKESNVNAIGSDLGYQPSAVEQQGQSNSDQQPQRHHKAIRRLPLPVVLTQNKTSIG
jgi:hypothetical protein